jgi:hypothetical protein
MLSFVRVMLGDRPHRALVPCLALALAVLVVPPARAESTRQCIAGCKPHKRACIAGFKARFATAKGACTGSGRKRCRRAARQAFVKGKRACATAFRRQCKPCCRRGESGCSVTACGDGRADAANGEVCDGADLGGATCASQGLGTGGLGCLPDCTGFDTTGCGPAGGGGGGRQIDLSGFDPRNPGPGWVAVNDAAAQDALIQEMWRVLTAPSCWDASVAGPVASVTQFQFYGQFEYRHYGFSISFGAIQAFGVGRYQGYPTAIVSTWTGDVEAVVILSDSTIAHVYPHIDGVTLIVTLYGTSNGPCL